MGGRGPSAWATFCCFPKCINREPDQKRGSWDANGQLNGILGSQMHMFTYYVAKTAPQIMFIYIVCLLSLTNESLIWFIDEQVFEYLGHVASVLSNLMWEMDLQSLRNVQNYRDYKVQSRSDRVKFSPRTYTTKTFYKTSFIWKPTLLLLVQMLRLMSYGFLTPESGALESILWICPSEEIPTCTKYNKLLILGFKNILSRAWHLFIFVESFLWSTDYRYSSAC